MATDTGKSTKQVGVQEELNFLIDRVSALERLVDTLCPEPREAENKPQLNTSESFNDFWNSLSARIHTLGLRIDVATEKLTKIIYG